MDVWGEVSLFVYLGSLSSILIRSESGSGPEADSSISWLRDNSYRVWLYILR